MSPEQFKGMRKDMHISQRELGELVGVTENTICLYERGKTRINKAVGMLTYVLWVYKLTGEMPRFTDLFGLGNNPATPVMITVIRDKHTVFEQVVNLVCQDHTGNKEPA